MQVCTCVLHCGGKQALLDQHHACPTCKQRFIGALQMAAAEAQVHTTCFDRNFHPAAVADLANTLTDKGSYAEALELHQKVLEFSNGLVRTC